METGAVITRFVLGDELTVEFKTKVNGIDYYMTRQAVNSQTPEGFLVTEFDYAAPAPPEEPSEPLPPEPTEPASPEGPEQPAEPSEPPGGTSTPPHFNFDWLINFFKSILDWLKNQFK
jgi:hypothetical protein